MLTAAGVVVIALAVAVIVAVIIAMVQSKHGFACPSCGKMFQPKWTQMVFEIHAFDKHRLKCPHCGMTGFCTDQGKTYRSGIQGSRT